MQAAKVASDQGVQLNVEVVNRFERFTMNARQESMENVQDVGNPCGNISQDTFHTNIEEDTIRSAVDRAGGLPGSPALARATSHRRTLATSSGMNTPPR